ncbi:hybrid sensor histidine kinase/response regulator [Paenibacillus flagellatus]|uniref:hybrid sensor histidine kinase/response regulator n=1 Tax=Paenibacillus flagellatus TaxID=2211139 RepID=UPI0013052846|nr:ATP-binding protein [Paenibacillus flagellatus]
MLDLRDVTWSRPILLEGEWRFYPERFLMRPGDETSRTDDVFAVLPGSWKGHFADPDRVTGYGSYRLRIVLGDSLGEKRFAIAMPPAMAASELYVDGVKLGAGGLPGKTADDTSASETPYAVAFTTDRSEVDIVIHVANFVNPVNGGLLQSIAFGTEAVVKSHKLFSAAMQLLVCVFLTIHMLYAAVLFLMGVRQRALFTFVLMMVCVSLTVLVSDDKLLVAWLNVPYGISFRLYTLSYLWATALLLLFMKQLYPALQKRPWHRYYGVAVLGLTIAVALMPTTGVAWVDLYTIPLLLAGFLYAPALLLRATLRLDRDAVYLWLAFVSLTVNLMAGISTQFSGAFRSVHYYPVDFIVAFVAFSCYWFRMYFRNLQQTERLAAELKKADKQKDDFLANTSHELRNPLHGMINMARSVLEQERLSPDAKERLKLLVTVGKRMSLLLNDLLDLERLQSGGVRLHPHAVHVQAAVDGVIDMVRFTMEGKSIELRNEISETFPPVMADENRMVQMVFNLLHNAVKFTVEGHIAIRGFVRGEWAVLEVEDTGVGIARDMLQRMFLPYEQADSSLTAMGGGLGLGLRISRQLAELHGGTLEADSELGQGSVFRLTLPIAQGIGETASPPSDAAEPGELSRRQTAVEQEPGVSWADSAVDADAEKPNVLIVDDDPVNLHILKETLPRHRYRVSAVHSAQEALKRIDEEEWDLVVTDVMMPRMSGYELTRMIRRRFAMSELPVLLLTARSRPEDIAAGFQSGANDYMTKPADGLELRHRVRALTELKRTTAERMRLEAAFLQAQVQPHFLFNTLNSIAALSELDAPRMQSLLSVFGKYLRASFDFRNFERLVPLERELELVRAYLFIEQARFNERLRVQWDVPEGLLSTPVPPLSIQTLVENGVRHGVMKRSRGGTVHIRAEDRGDCVEIRVSDDGVGFAEDVLRRLSNDSPDPSVGIGLRNTNRRLRQIFGRGLDIASAAGEGATVSFQVRKRGS